MNVRLIKRNLEEVVEEKREQSTSQTDLMLKTQSWVDEFKARKAKGDQSLRALLQRSAA